MKTILAIAALTVVFTKSLEAGLVVNGSFETGNIGFASEHSFAVSNTGEGQYGIGPNPITWFTTFSSFGDHTSGSGNMMYVNGSTSPAVVWRQSVAVQAGSSYEFSGWVASMYSGSPASLRLSINGIVVGDAWEPSTTVGVWTGFSTTWNSGLQSTAILEINNTNTSFDGNDFALDDLSFHSTSAVPEPSSWVLASIGCLAFYARRASRRRRQIL
jgi:hypothetical protein